MLCLCVCVVCVCGADEFSEDLLSAHESEVDRMKGFYQDNREIFELLQKRQKLWQQQTDLDVRKWTDYGTVYIMS